MVNLVVFGSLFGLGFSLVCGYLAGNLVIGFRWRISEFRLENIIECYRFVSGCLYDGERDFRTEEVLVCLGGVLREYLFLG